MIAAEDALRSLLGEPSALVQSKVADRLNELTRQFIERSPFLCLATSAADGTLRRLPRGDPAGFVRILDERTLLLPDRPGNRLADSLRNVLENPHVALLFMIPGVTDTFRVNGRARSSTDPELLEQCAVEGKAPKLGLRIEIDEATRTARRRSCARTLGSGARSSTARELPSPGELLRSVGAEVEPETYDAERDERYAAPRRLLLIEYRFVDCAYDARPVGGGARAVPRGAHPGRVVPRRRSSPTSRSRGRAGIRCRATRRLRRRRARAGIGEGVFVVAYDHGAAGGAARLWWLLRHYGHEDVAVLRGGFDVVARAGARRRGGDRAARVRPAAARRRHDRRRRARGAARRAGPGRRRRALARSATAARSSRSTRSPAGSPARSTGSTRRRASRRPRSPRRTRSSSTAARGSPRASTCSRSRRRAGRTRSSTRARGATGARPSGG